MKKKAVVKKWTGLMTEDEVTARWNDGKGESALELSIEKWDRIYEYLKKNYGRPEYRSLTYGSYCGRTCALCIEGDLWGNCHKCSYYKKYKMCCDYSDGEMCCDYSDGEGNIGHWRKFQKALDEKFPIKNKILNAALEMRDALIACRPKKRVRTKRVVKNKTVKKIKNKTK